MHARTEIASDGNVDDAEYSDLSDPDDEFSTRRPQMNSSQGSTLSGSLDAAADKIYDAWAKFAVAWELYSDTQDVFVGENKTRYDPLKLYYRVDVLDWFAKKGESQFPSISLLARIHLSRPISSAFVERFFSVAGLVLSLKRTQLESKRAEKLQLLKQNWKLFNELMDELATTK